MTLKESINKKINDNLKPSFFKIINFSDQHKNHYSGDNKDTSHIKIIIVSELFNGHSRIERERIVHNILREEILTEIHSIRLKLYIQSEYDLVK
tara:strand:- start:924 stop:1205 length:282 start_codon:yes stop_codon:yes gene_type:complete